MRQQKVTAREEGETKAERRIKSYFVCLVWQSLVIVGPVTAPRQDRNGLSENGLVRGSHHWCLCAFVPLCLSA